MVDSEGVVKVRSFIPLARYGNFYVSQDFVNRHLLFAPEELRAYPVWVARYGEYKPYVHLLYWQLSPDGTVEGIRGHVDIDVFNGTEEQFRHYLRTQTVK